MYKRQTPASSGVVISVIEMVGAVSSSAIVRMPRTSFKVTSEGLLSVTVTVSFTSSVVSDSTPTAIFCDVTPGANVIVPESAV